MIVDDGTIGLDAIERSDLETLRVGRNSPRVRVRTREYRALTMLDQERWYARISAPDTRHVMFKVLCLKSLADSNHPTDRIVGVVGLCHWDPRDQTAETSFYLLNWRDERKGYMRRALKMLHGWGFDELNLERIWAEVYRFNEPGLALLKTMGFTVEGTLRQHVVREGVRCDSLMLGLLRSEWLECVDE